MYDLYSGEEINAWTDTFDDGDRFVEVVFFFNGVSLNMPSSTFKAVVEELNRSVKMLELHEQQEAEKPEAAS